MACSCTRKPVWCSSPGYWSAPAGAPLPAVQDTLQAARIVGSQALAAEAQCAVTCKLLPQPQVLAVQAHTAPGQVQRLLLQSVDRASQYGCATDSCCGRVNLLRGFSTGEIVFEQWEVPK